MVNDLTKGNPARVILNFSLPVIIGNICQQVYNFVDTVIVGRFISYEALAGVGITNCFTFLVLGFVWGITSGLSIRTAQLFGARDMAGMRRSVGTSLVISIILTVVLTLLTVLLTAPSLHLINTRAEVYDYAYEYLIIVFGGIFGQVAYNMISYILRALGDSRTPLFFLILSSVLNIGLDLLFIISFGWGVRGAAYATVISQAVSALLCFIYAFRRYPELKLSRDDFRTDWKFAWEHLRIGIPMALQFSITATGIVFLQAALNNFPPTYIAGFTAASKVQNLFMQIPIGFGVAIASYVGQNWGAGEIGRVRKGVNATLVMTLCVCIVMSTMMSLLSRPMTSLFLSADAGEMVAPIYDASNRYLHITAIFFPFLYLIFLYRNALQGIGRTFLPLMAGVLELVIRTAASLTLPRHFGYDGIVFTDVLSWIGASIMLLISYLVQMPKK